MSFPLVALVEQTDVALALSLAAIDRRIGGVLLRGEKGSGKTTAARGLADLMPGTASFVEIPLGATEDRVVGSFDVRAALSGGEYRFQPGLLSSAHDGVLYVDEVNLLADHLVDVLLDAAATGVNRVERDGIAEVHPSRFVLVGSMNAEEGELRPQLLDRFGLSVDVAAPRRPQARAEAVARRRAFEEDPEEFSAVWTEKTAELARQIASAVPGLVSRELQEEIGALALSAGVEGLRADLVLARAAGAVAGLEGRAHATSEDVRRVAPMVLGHRRSRPWGESHPSPIEELVEEFFDHTTATEDMGGEAGSPASKTFVIGTSVGQARPREVPRQTAESERGRVRGSRPLDGGSLAGGATVRAAIQRGGTLTGLVEDDLRESVKERVDSRLSVFVIDASGSMGAERRIALASEAIGSLLRGVYERRERVAVVTFGGNGAEVAVRPTGSVEIVAHRLGDVSTGGTTPLASGLLKGFELARRSATADEQIRLVVLTDGRATGSDTAFEDALTAARGIAKAGCEAVVVDCETGPPPRLGLARELAAAMGADIRPADAVD